MSDQFMFIREAMVAVIINFCVAILSKAPIFASKDLLTRSANRRYSMLKSFLKQLGYDDGAIEIENSVFQCAEFPFGKFSQESRPTAGRSNVLANTSLEVIRYELFVGQPPFYTNSVYALIRHIIKDPVKYPDNMSSNFRSFLKGLLNKVPQNRLTWHALLEHPFVKETQVDEEVSAATTESPRGFDAALRHERSVQKPREFVVRDSKNYSPSRESEFVQCSPTNIQSKRTNSTVDAMPREELPNFPRKDGAPQSGCQVLDRLENNSRTVKGANLIGQDNETLAAIMQPLKKECSGSENSCMKISLLYNQQV